MDTSHCDGNWVTEIHKGIVGLSFKIEKTLFSGQSPFQQVEILQTAGHGKLLINDGVIMISERDEFVYHEMIAHVPLFVHPRPQRVLIIGGGDGGTVREVVKHASVERVVMVEIDEMVVRACRDHMPSVAGALDHPGVELIIDDGCRYVETADERFDVVIVDSSDPVGPAQPLFDEPFYAAAARRLADGGILVTQAESPFYDRDLQLPMLRNQRPHFKNLHLYQMTNMTYPAGLWSFGFASNRWHPLEHFDLSRVEAADFGCRYYNPGIHRAAFMLPTFLQEALQAVLDPIGWGDLPANCSQRVDST